MSPVKLAPSNLIASPQPRLLMCWFVVVPAALKPDMYSINPAFLPPTLLKEKVTVGSLTVMPLWLAENYSVPLDLEAGYREACRYAAIG